MGDRTNGFTRFPDGKREQRARRNCADRSRHLPMDIAQGRLSRPMSDAAPVPDAPRRLSQRLGGLPPARSSARCLLRRLLLDSDDAAVCGRGDERALDCAPGAACPSGETDSNRTVDRARGRRCLCRRGRLDVRASGSDAVMNHRVAKRALAMGYRNVVWYPDGTDGWEDALLTVAVCKPEPRPGE